MTANSSTESMISTQLKTSNADGSATLIPLELPTALGSPPNPLISLCGIPLSTSIPPSACIPVPAPLSDLIVARVYACVVWQGGGMDGQETETE